jgi:ceramide glucosyltransferase
MILSALLVGFYFLAAVSIYLGLVSLRNGIRFVRYLQQELGKEYPAFTPFASVIVPLRGVDQDLNENITAIFAQDYPTFEVIFVADSKGDPAIEVVAAARRSFSSKSGPTMKIVIAGSAVDCGQKVHNLSHAVTEVDPGSEVFVFVDTDAQPQPGWLRALVAPLQDETIGASTGYRWFVTRGGGWPAHLRSVWNAAIASALGAQGDKNFCWGGSTAIRRETFQRVRVLDYWSGTVSDDFAMTRALHKASMPIKFVPRCLTPSFENSSLAEVVEFTNRQMKITRAYATHLWRAVLTGSVIFVLVFFGGLALVITRAFLGLSFLVPMWLLLLIFLMGAMKSHLRLQAVRAVIQDSGVHTVAAGIAHITLWPVASALFLYNTLIAAGSRRITWRGLTYELRSSTETVILADDKRRS